MRVRAYDQGNPIKEGEAQIGIVVTRNQFPPVFIDGPYTQTVSENLPNNTGIYTLRGSDQDLKGELRYEVLGISPAPLFFRVNPTAGTVFTRDDLRKDRGLTYTVIIYHFTKVQIFKHCISKSHFSVQWILEMICSASFVLITCCKYIYCIYFIIVASGSVRQWEPRRKSFHWDDDFRQQEREFTLIHQRSVSENSPGELCFGIFTPQCWGYRWWWGINALLSYTY